MIEKILGVACLIAAGAMYTAERLSMINQAHGNYFVWALSILGSLLLLWDVVAGIGHALKRLPNEIEAENRRLEEYVNKKHS